MAEEQVAGFEAKSKLLEESKFESEHELISSKELVQRLEGKRAELEAELQRTEDAFDKVRVSVIIGN